MSEVHALKPREAMQIARLDPQALLAAAVEKDAGIETLERLVALAKDVRAEQARTEWYEAMADFQRTCPTIRKTARADTGKFRYNYAPLDEIMSTILPVMGPLGLSVSWRGRIEPGQVVQNCRVSHTAGHYEESGDVAMPVGTDDRGASPPQRVGIATTYAKRYSLLSIVGLAPEDDDDANHVGDKTAVQQPRRASAASAPRTETTDGLTVVGVVLAKEGRSANGPWKKYEVALSDGRKVSTFSDTLADIAQQFQKTGEAIRVATKEGKYGLELEEIEAEFSE